MENPSLRLTVEKGPRKGEALDCKPGAVSRVGRVIKGNHFAVRDPGVSQKHLTFQFLPDVSRWSVSDLDTSNGTFVNDNKIPPTAPFPLSDGDVIKVGESTAISVKILATERRDVDEGHVEEEKESNGARPRRGRARKGAPPLPVVEESAADVGDGVSVRKGKGRPKRGAAVPKKDEVLEPPVVEESSEMGTKMVAVEKRRGLGRRPATRSTTAKVFQDEEEMEDPHDSVQVVSSNAVEVVDAFEIATISKDEEEMVDPNDAVQVADFKAVEDVEAVEIGDAVGSHATMEAASDFKAVENVETVEIGDAIVGSDAAKEAADSEQEEMAVEKEVVEDMENMTLGEWFDRMEKALPLMINDVAEEIIASLRDKAQQFDKFIAKSSASH
ncbi:hypothetical protein Cni_G08993 [Canna indica]|uniref:FHA domain-containing protein n=1 Tax=Canna indica TaxID=4628 RepID=A0AAQ3K1I7_9LILI|nr:hypothetical protein Cni_G08993 [Canna indica]